MPFPYNLSIASNFLSLIWYLNSLILQAKKLYYIYGTLAEWSNAGACKALQPWVQIPQVPIFFFDGRQSFFIFDFYYPNNYSRSMQKLTPAMQQYMDLKKQYPDCILFFRLGDFYEVFREDAQLCSKLLDLILTAKNKTSDYPIPMAGMPYHSVDKYIPKLIKAGYKVAIADQMTEPKPWQIVQRAITSIITPGTYIDDKQTDTNYILSISTQGTDQQITYHLARGDFVAGQYWTTSVDSLSALHQLITLTNPKEIILHKTSPHIRELADSLKTQPHTVVAYRDMLDESESFTLSLLRVQSLASFGKALTEGRVIPFALLLSYLISTQQKTITTIYRVSYYHPDDYVLLDEVTMKNLELFASSYDHDQTYSLFGTLDQCQSISGSKLLKHIIAHPSKNMSLINERLAHIASWIQDYDQAVQITKLIGSLHDIPRLLTTLIYKTPSYVPFVRLRTTLQTILYSGEGNGCQEALLSIDKDVKINTLTDLCDRLDAALRSADDLAPNAEEYIRDGYDAQIDELRTLIHHTDQILLWYHQQLINHTKISDIRIVFVTNQWYMIEVTPKHITALEATRVQGDEYFDLERRQTLKTGQRYSTPYLDTLQHKLLSAKDQLAKAELAILRSLQEEIIWQYHDLAHLSDTLAHLDVYTSHALYVRQHRFVQPEIIRGTGLHIVWGRHPVIEAHLPVTDSFIPNDLDIDQQIHVITWPNMGGKSTFLRHMPWLCYLRIVDSLSQLVKRR